MTGAQNKKSFQREQVVEIINSVIGKVRGPETASREIICRELTGLKETIENLRHQLHFAAPADIGQTHIPNATDELDAVVGMTEQATGTIMDACECVLAGMEGADEALAQKTEAEIVRIYEACTFQDITGQRIAKVVKTLKTIDEKVTSLLEALNGTLATNLHEKGDASGGKDGTSLLNGPALPGQAVTQEDIDRLLANL